MELPDNPVRVKESEFVLKAIDIHKSFPSGKGELQVLKGVGFEVRAGELVSVVGTSGVGKSTLLHILGTLEPPDRGLLEIEGEDVLALGDGELATFRNQKIGFVFQFHHLLPEFTAWENVALPRLIAGYSLEEAKRKAVELLGEMGLLGRLNHRPAELSGGEQQRVAVARALANEPEVILADEPSGNLDRVSAEELHALIWSLNKERGQSLIIVTHNEELASRAQRKMQLVDGLIREA